MPDVTKELELKDGEENSVHAALLKHVLDRVSRSRKDMQQYYSTWDYQDQVFRSRRAPDREDSKSQAKGEPGKLIVPLTLSQVMTFVAYAVQSVTQNKRFFELERQGNKNPALLEPCELILERDVRRNKWNAFLVQFFLDVARFWIGCAEVCYVEQTRMMRVEKTEKEVGAFGTESERHTSDFEEIPVFVGNRVYPLSPYRFFPDTSLPLTRYQEGEFCGSEDMFTMSSLRGDKKALMNLDRIPKMGEKDYKLRREKTRIAEMPFIPERRDPNISDDAMMKEGTLVVTKMVLDIIPNDFVVDEKKPLGKEEFPVRYLCWIANDHTIIRFEEAYYLHGQFPYIAAQYLPDQHQLVNEGLSATCDQITNLITWKLNAHLKSQKNSVDSRWIVDPSGIEMKSLNSDSPYIFLKKNAAQTGVDRYIRQFETRDVTAGVMGDVAGLKDLLEAITGISAQMQGQYSQGRRSATQDRVVAQGAGARAKTTLSSVWDEAFECLGKQFLTNNRQEMDEETFYAIVGEGPFGANNVTKEELFVLFKADPVALARSEDFFVFDGTSASEKAFLAQSLQEIFMQILQNPMMLQILGYGPEQVRYLFEEIYELRGVTPPSLPASPTAAPGQVVPMTPAAPPVVSYGQ